MNSKMISGCVAVFLCIAVTAAPLAAKDLTIADVMRMDDAQFGAYLGSELERVTTHLRSLNQPERAECIRKWAYGAEFRGSKELGFVVGGASHKGYDDWSARAIIETAIRKACGDWDADAPIPAEPRLFDTDL